MMHDAIYKMFSDFQKRKDVVFRDDLRRHLFVFAGCGSRRFPSCFNFCDL